MMSIWSPGSVLPMFLTVCLEVLPFVSTTNENSALVRSPPYVDVETLASTHGEKVGSKRKGETHKENHGVEGHAASLVNSGNCCNCLMVLILQAPGGRKKSKASSQSCYAKVAN